MPKNLDEIMKALHGAADKIAPTMYSAFLAAIKEIRDNLYSVEAVEAALLSQGVNAAVTASGIDKLEELLFGVGLPGGNFILSTQMQGAFIAGALAAISNLDASKQKQLSFNSLNERAVEIMRYRGSQTITGVSNLSRVAIHDSLVRSLSDNLTPRKAATDLRQSLGLAPNQMQAVTNFRRQLETKQILGFTPPYDRRLNAIEQSMIRRHMREGHFTTANIDAMVERYYQSLLNKRAMDIARTESMSAVNAGQLELWEQGLDMGIFDDNFERKFWIVTPDDRLRPTHKAIPNMNPNGVKIRAMFITPFGPVYGPGDANSGLINCRCILVLGQIGQTFKF